MENAVTFYPQYSDLYTGSAKMIEQLGGTAYIPVIGGKNIEFVKKLFGWKIARIVQFYFQNFAR